MGNFKAVDYAEYNHKLGFDLYSYLYQLMEELVNYIPFDIKNFEDDTTFVYSGMNVYIDKKFGSHCEIINTGWLPIRKRVFLHEKKLLELKNIIQLTLF